MIWRILAMFVMLAAAVANSGCESSVTAIKPEGTVEVPLDAANKLGSVTVRLANLVTFSLPPASPELMWTISLHDTRYLKQHTGFVPPKTPDAGCTVSFVAVTTGSTRLRFVLVPVSSGRSVDPVDQQDVKVTIR